MLLDRKAEDCERDYAGLGPLGGKENGTNDVTGLGRSSLIHREVYKMIGDGRSTGR